MNPLRIAFLTTEYVSEPSFDGGLANYLHRTCLALAARGHSVEVFCSAHADETIEHDGITVHRVRHSPGLYALLSRFTRRRVDPALRILLTGWALRRAFLRRHHACAFDLVQAASFEAAGLGLALFRPVPMTVRVSSFHPLWQKTNYPGGTPADLSHTLVSALERYVLRHNDGVYAPSARMAEYIQAQVGVKTHVIRPPFMIEVRTFDRSVVETRLAGLRYLLYFGTINRLKGGFVLAEALPLVLQRHPDMHVVLVGKTESFPRGYPLVERIIAAVGEHATRVHYLGQLPHSQLYPVVEAAHAVLLPSLTDNLPNTCMEAMSLRRVVIGTRGASFEELIEDGVSGLLVAPGDAPGLAEAMARVWQMSDAERERLGAAAQARLAELSPETACLALEAWYRGLLSPARQAST